MKKWLMFSSGVAFGLISITAFLEGAMGAVPTRVTDDTALYQSISEIKARREGIMNFDSDIERLSKMEARFNEKLPRVHARVHAPMKRIAAQKYVKRGSQTAAR